MIWVSPASPFPSPSACTSTRAALGLPLSRSALDRPSGHAPTSSESCDRAYLIPEITKPALPPLMKSGRATALSGSRQARVPATCPANRDIRRLWFTTDSSDISITSRETACLAIESTLMCLSFTFPSRQPGRGLPPWPHAWVAYRNTGTRQPVDRPHRSAWPCPYR